MTDPKPARPLVVCVDDDQLILDSVARCLRRAPFDVRATTSCAEVIRWITDEPVAVLVSDYEMPEMTGAQLAGAVKRIRPETVRILLTGRRTLDTAIDGINQGEIFKFIAKPFDSDALRSDVLAAAVRHDELVALSGDRQRRARRDRLRADLEAEYPGITTITRDEDGTYYVRADPRIEAAALGLGSLLETPP
jgi:DNA-binding NtrC family response regulator